MSDLRGQISVKVMQSAKADRHERKAFQDLEGANDQQTAALLVRLLM